MDTKGAGGQDCCLKYGRGFIHYSQSSIRVTLTECGQKSQKYFSPLNSSFWFWLKAGRKTEWCTAWRKKNVLYCHKIFRMSGSFTSASGDSALLEDKTLKWRSFSGAGKLKIVFYYTESVDYWLLLLLYYIMNYSAGHHQNCNVNNKI